MLKKRIKKWDLDRHRKQADMLHAVKIALERESQGKKTAFLIRGRVVTFEAVQHYFRRKGVRDLRSLLKDANAAVPTTRIECLTPTPVRIPDESEHYQVTGIEIASERSENYHSSSGILVISDPSQVARVLQQSPELDQLDQLLHYGRNYYDRLFEGRDWKRQQKAFELSSLEIFYHKLFDGHDMLDAGYVSVAFEYFDVAFDYIRVILDEGVMLFLPYLYHILLPGRGFHDQHVLLNLLQFISQMIHTRFPHLRPIENSLVLLWGMPVEQRSNCSARVFQSLLDQLKGEFHDDVPDELQLREATKVLCYATQKPLGQEAQSYDSYKMTSLAVWKLARDAELLHTPITSQAAVLQDAKAPSKHFFYRLHW